MENAVHQARVLRRGHLTIVDNGTHAVDDEVEQLLPDFKAALQRFLAADTAVEIDAAMKALPAETTLPRLGLLGAIVTVCPCAAPSGRQATARAPMQCRSL